MFTAGAHDGKTVPLVPRTTLALRADWLVAPQQRINAGVVWASEQSVDFNNLCKIPVYAVADARYAYQVKNMELSLGINNLFDRHYVASCGSDVQCYWGWDRRIVATATFQF